MIYIQSVLNRLRLVIISEHEFCSADIADAFFFGRDELDVIGSAAVRAGSSSAHAVHDILIRNFDVDRVVDLFTVSGELLREDFRLRDRSRETVRAAL